MKDHIFAIGLVLFVLLMAGMNYRMNITLTKQVIELRDELDMNYEAMVTASTNLIHESDDRHKDDYQALQDKLEERIGLVEHELDNLLFIFHSKKKR